MTQIVPIFYLFFFPSYFLSNFFTSLSQSLLSRSISIILFHCCLGSFCTLSTGIRICWLYSLQKSKTAPTQKKVELSWVWYQTAFWRSEKRGSIPSLPLLPGPLSTRVAVCVRGKKICLKIIHAWLVWFYGTSTFVGY